jgi:lipopolysaccharide export system permease protein
LKPILAIGAGVTLLFYVLDSTQFTYSIEKAKAILHGGGSWSKDSYFLKWNGRIISIRKLNPMVGKAEDINIFYLSPQNRLTKVISAKIARYQEESNGWVAPEANITTITPEKMERKVVKNYHFLEAFKPKVVYNLKSVDTISFTDAYYALKYFKNLDVNVILGIVFFKIFTPLLVLVMIIFTFLSAPLQTRTGNLPLFMIKFALLGVLIWGIELLLFKFTKQGVLPIYLLALPPLMGGVGVVYKILRS